MRGVMKTRIYQWFARIDSCDGRILANAAKEDPNGNTLGDGSERRFECRAYMSFAACSAAEVQILAPDRWLDRHRQLNLNHWPPAGGLR